MTCLPSRKREGLGVGMKYTMTLVSHPPTPSRRREGEQ